MPLSRLQNIYTPFLHVTLIKSAVGFGERSAPSSFLLYILGVGEGKERKDSQVRPTVQVIFPWHLVIVMKVCVNIELFLQKELK